MNILVTGAAGFVGQNLCRALENIRDGKDRTHPGLEIEEIFAYTRQSGADALADWCGRADFVFNLAGVNRPKDTGEFMQGNCGFAGELLDALKRAGRACIKTMTLDRKKLGKELFERELAAALEGYDLIILAGFMCILSEDFTHKFDKKIINIHPSLIPSFCGEGFYGLHVHEAALKRGVKVTGATVHYVNEIPDGGEIIMQKAVRVRQNDTPETLQARVMREAERIILPRAAEKICREMFEKEEEEKDECI